MRWPQFILALINLGFSVYVIITTTLFANHIAPLTFLWTLVYLTLSIAIAHLYMLYLSNKIDDWYDVDSMQSITNLSIVSLTACLTALVVNISLEYYNTKQFFATDSIKQIVPLVASFICSIILFTSSIKFKKYVILCRSDDMPTQTLKRNYRTTD